MVIIVKGKPKFINQHHIISANLKENNSVKFYISFEGESVYPYMTVEFDSEKEAIAAIYTLESCFNKGNKNESNY